MKIVILPFKSSHERGKAIFATLKRGISPKCIFTFPITTFQKADRFSFDFTRRYINLHDRQEGFRYSCQSLF